MNALQQLRAAVRQRASAGCLPSWRAAAIELACVHEARAPKVGNVHPAAAFSDCDYDDFCRAARQVAPILAGIERSVAPRSPRSSTAGQYPPLLGRRVLEAVQATRRVTAANVNLGIILLIAPLAAVDSADQIGPLLASLDRQQTALYYQAIGLAKPGGVHPGEVDPQWDVTAAAGDAVPAAASGRGQPTQGFQASRIFSASQGGLVEAMRMAAGRDRIARQYADGFQDWLQSVVPVVRRELTVGQDIDRAILLAQLRLLAVEPPDSLIARKCGTALAEEVQRRSAACWPIDSQTAVPGTDPDWGRVDQLDRWLRADGNRRNPGTTADLIAAAIYWLIRPVASTDAER